MYAITDRAYLLQATSRTDCISDVLRVNNDGDKPRKLLRRHKDYERQLHAERYNHVFLKRALRQ